MKRTLLAAALAGHLCRASNARDGADRPDHARRRNRRDRVLHPGWRSHQRPLRRNVLPDRRWRLGRAFERGRPSSSKRRNARSWRSRFWTAHARLPVQFDFVGKTIKYSVTNPPQWKERYVILSAVDKAGSEDCIELASLPGAPGGPPLPAGANVKLIQFIGIPPKTVFSIPAGTKITAMTGPPCPASVGAPPGSMLSPGGKECHPPGSVACPASRGGGFCPAGQFCDAFSFACIAAGDPRLCPIQPAAFETGQNLHCALGETCTLSMPRPCDDGGGGQPPLNPTSG